MSERDPWLSREAVERLTAGPDGKPCKRRMVQCKRLAEMNIPFKPNWAGWPLVEPAALGLTVIPSRGHRSPDWGKVKRGQAKKAQPASSAANDDAARRVLPFGAGRG